jgi:hypothetical protein
MARVYVSTRAVSSLTTLSYVPFLAGGLLVGYPVRVLYVKFCAALDAVARKVGHPVQAFIVDQAAPILGGISAFWGVAKDWRLRLAKGVAGGVAHFLVAVWRWRPPQGAQASPAAVAEAEARR